jgi:hypothetical protein
MRQSVWGLWKTYRYRVVTRSTALKQGKKMTRRKWDKMPMQMPRSIVKRNNRHAKQNKAHSKLTFTNKKNIPCSNATNKEHNEQPEGLVGEEASPFPDITL